MLIGLLDTAESNIGKNNMGLFNFSKYNEIEKALFDLHVHNLSMNGISSSEARKMTENMLDQAIEKSKKSGNYFLPKNLGSIIVGEADTEDLRIQKFAHVIRERMPKNEGITLDDIKMWWNLNDVERRMVQAQDLVEKFQAGLGLLDSGKASSPEEATAMVCKFLPVYGNPDDNSQSSGDDRPLPFELKDRINIYIEKQACKGSTEYKEEMESSSSFNALVRKEIRAGKL